VEGQIWWPRAVRRREQLCALGATSVEDSRVACKRSGRGALGSNTEDENIGADVDSLARLAAAQPFLKEAGLN